MFRFGFLAKGFACSLVHSLHRTHLFSSPFSCFGKDSPKILMESLRGQALPRREGPMLSSPLLIRFFWR
ncbi:hypothetical protein I3842_05G133400 [Carya illinoinensis]|uniref:Uncharacterized protein n=1 Tax=Carya illinoinensis TaxID=32201 RepID=A0A922F4H1_CARIL|nr:hypothetical protein I3842_05G133400 [Carya illinoinensis]